MKLSILLALAITASAALPAAADAPSYATANRETIQGSIEAVTGKYTLTLSDVRGYYDSVTLHDGTVITPTGTRLYPRQSVTIAGHADGKTFDAEEIDVDPATIAPELPVDSYYDGSCPLVSAPCAPPPYYYGYGDPYARYYYGAPYDFGSPYYGYPSYYGVPYYYYTPNFVPNAGKQNYAPPPFWTGGSSSGGAASGGTPRMRQPIATRPEAHGSQPAAQPAQPPASHGSSSRSTEPSHQSTRHQ